MLFKTLYDGFESLLINTNFAVELLQVGLTQIFLCQAHSHKKKIKKE